MSKILLTDGLLRKKISSGFVLKWEGIFWNFSRYKWLKSVFLDKCLTFAFFDSSPSCVVFSLPEIF